MSLFDREFVVVEKSHGFYDVVAVTHWSNGEVTRRIIASYDLEQVAIEKARTLNETLGGKR